MSTHTQDFLLNACLSPRLRKDTGEITPFWPPVAQSQVTNKINHEQSRESPKRHSLTHRESPSQADKHRLGRRQMSTLALLLTLTKRKA